jgi:Mn-dependent DtxR family transcriptional regulator
VTRRAPPTAPSPRQADVLEAVRALTAEGLPASAVAIAARLGISRQLTMRQLAALERKGILADVPKVVRSGHWALTPAGKRLE